MNQEEIKRRFTNLSAETKLRVLARLGHNLTVAARDTYEFQASGVKAPQRLRALNEIQHRVVGQIVHIHEGGEWWDLLPLLVEHGDYELQNACLWALGEAIERYDR